MSDQLFRTAQFAFRNYSNNASTSCRDSSIITSPVLMGSILIVIALVGGTGNLVLGALVTRRDEMRSRINIILAVIAISDALVSLVCAPIEIASVILVPNSVGETVCQAHAFLLSLLVLQNILLLVIISADRYSLLVCNTDLLKKWDLPILLPGCIVISALASSLPLFGIGCAIFSRTNCRLYASPKGDIYSKMYSIVFFISPFGILLVAYIRILLTMRKTVRRIRPAFINRIKYNQSQINKKFKQKTFYTILYLFVAAVICKLPMSVYYLLPRTAPCPLPIWILVLVYLNPVINPFVYAMKLKQYRRVLTGRFRDVTNPVNSFKTSRKRSNPESIYRVSIVSSNCVA